MKVKVLLESNGRRGRKITHQVLLLTPELSRWPHPRPRGQEGINILLYSWIDHSC